MTAGANNGVDWTRTGDAEVRSRLEDELERLRACDSFAALGLGYDANDRQVRAAFLRITKTYHPNRFARRNPEIFRLANEVFLRMNKAYSRLSSTSKRLREISRLGVGRHTLVGSREPVREDAPEPAPSPAGNEKPRAPGTNPSLRSKTPGTNPSLRSKTPGTNPSLRSKAPGTNPSLRSPAPGTNPSLRSRTPGTSPGQPTPPVEIDLRRATATARRIRRAGTGRHQLATPPPEETDWTSVFRRAKAKLETGAYSAAHEEFKQLAVRDPGNKSYRVYMHYARGRELQAAEQADRARAEYNRALALDAHFAPARAAIESLDGPKPRGLLSKWFKK